MNELLQINLIEVYLFLCFFESNDNSNFGVI